METPSQQPEETTERDGAEAEPPRGAYILARWPTTEEEIEQFYAALQEEYEAMQARRRARREPME